MNNILFLVLLATVAGFFTVLGCAFTFAGKQKSEKTIAFALGFAAGIMIGVSLIDLLPEALTRYHNVAGKYSALFFIFFMLTGVLFAKLIDGFVPKTSSLKQNDNHHRSLYRTGIVSMIVIMLHKFPEGIAMFASGYHDLSLGITIAVAIAIHNFPEGVAIAMPIYYATGSRFKAFKYTLLAAITEPFGVISAAFILRPFLNQFMLATIFAFVIGLMLCIAFDELIPASKEYNYKNLTLVGIFIGICTMPFSKIFM